MDSSASFWQAGRKATAKVRARAGAHTGKKRFNMILKI
jgi:hypothetical protein